MSGVEGDREPGFETRAIHAGQPADPATGAVMVPVYLTSTFAQEGVGRHRGYEYARTSNPTRGALEACLASLEGAAHGLAFASGMAAEDAVLRLLGPGDHVVLPTDAYGGTWIYLEQAPELGVNAVDLRRTNLVPASAMPYKTATGVTYDCGDFAGQMEAALKLADVAGFPARREAARRRGRLRGLGIANAIERAAGPQPEFAEIRFAPSGSATVFMGTKNQGQGHETTFKQILHERLGLDPGDVRYIDGDTDRVAFGMGSMGSRSTVIGGTALWTAADKVIAKGRKIAAKMLEAAEADITFANGAFSVVGTDRALPLQDVARAAFQPGSLPRGVEPGLYETGTFSPLSDTWPNGCHVCEVEIDPETGAVALVAYVVADDVGTVINPVTLKGQIHGGVAQGVGQALMEQIVYDPDSGQLLTASFMDYALPRADTLPEMVIESHPVPTKLNPLGAKGAGEAGTVGALPVVMNAVLDALAPLGVRHLDMPASAERVWNAIRDARRG